MKLGVSFYDLKIDIPAKAWTDVIPTKKNDRIIKLAINKALRKQISQKDWCSKHSFVESIGPVDKHCI